MFNPKVSDVDTCDLKYTRQFVYSLAAKANTRLTSRIHTASKILGRRQTLSFS